LTRVSLDKIKEYEDQLKSGVNPRDIKIQLAKVIVEMYHSKEDADKAEQYFINTFTKKEIPDDIEEFCAEHEITVDYYIEEFV
jgi:tyrosyl-tRNA synthetase